MTIPVLVDSMQRNVFQYKSGKGENMPAILCHMVNGVSVQSYQIEKETVHIGRSVDSDIYLDEKSVSSKHAVIEKTATGNSVKYSIRDLESTNHTFVNNVKIDEKVLENSDMIRIGVTVLKFVTEDDSVDFTKTVKIKKSWIPGIYFSSD